MKKTIIVEFPDDFQFPKYFNGYVLRKKEVTKHRKMLIEKHGNPDKFVKTSVPYDMEEITPCDDCPMCEYDGIRNEKYCLLTYDNGKVDIWSDLFSKRVNHDRPKCPFSQGEETFNYNFKNE